MNEYREKAYAYWLSQIKGVGRITIFNLIHRFGSAENVYFSKETCVSEALSRKQYEQLKESKKSWNVDSEFDKLSKQNIKFYHFGDSMYPEKLRLIPDPPYTLYVKGNLPIQGVRTMAVIGARTCTEYGRMAAGHFTEAFARNGVQIISGMARGIDGISQQIALNNGGKTYAVLGCGCNVCYPPENRALYEKIFETGGIISEYPPDTQPASSLFPPRNRIISGLSDAVLVIEAKEKSGTLITVDMALEQGKDIFAVPGRISDSLSHGCNKLIRQGAGIATSPMEILNELYGESNDENKIKIENNSDDNLGNCINNGTNNGNTMNDVTEREKIILQKVDYIPVSFETLLNLCRGSLPGLSLQQFSTDLLLLQLKGKIGREGSHYFKVGTEKTVF